MFGVWMVCIVLLVSVSSSISLQCMREDACDSHITDGKLQVHTVIANADSVVGIQCPNLTGHANASLHKEYSLHSTFLNKTHNSSETKEWIPVHMNNHTVRYSILHPQVSDTGLYTCSVLHRKTQTFLLVEDAVPCPDEENPLVWIMLAAGSGLVALYSLITTMVVCFFGWKLRDEETFQSDYYNTKPGEFSPVR